MLIRCVIDQVESKVVNAESLEDFIVKICKDGDNIDDVAVLDPDGFKVEENETFLTILEQDKKAVFNVTKSPNSADSVDDFLSNHISPLTHGDLRLDSNLTTPSSSFASRSVSPVRSRKRLSAARNPLQPVDSSKVPKFTDIAETIKQKVPDVLNASDEGKLVLENFESTKKLSGAEETVILEKTCHSILNNYGS